MIQELGAYTVSLYKQTRIKHTPLPHLRCKLILAFLIACRSSSVCLYVGLSVKCLHFYLLQNYWTNINHMWHKSSFGKGESRFNKYVSFKPQNGDYIFFSVFQRFNDGIKIALRKCFYWLEHLPRWAIWAVCLLFNLIPPINYLHNIIDESLHKETKLAQCSISYKKKSTRLTFKSI